MADLTPQNISKIRTMEDVAYMLSILFTNLNYLDRIYYDMFINPVPMDIDLKRYDETGKLVTVTLANRAKDILNTYSGVGNPNGVQVARTGALYVDTSTSAMYYKGSGSDSYGWSLLLSSLNFIAGQDYLTPSGDGSQLTGLNAANINSGTLSVPRGGTGVNYITGLLKGDGDRPFKTAVDGDDYLGPNSFTGMIAFYPNNKIPKGWLRCDGAAYSRATYSRLFDVISVMYGPGDGLTTFNVPDLRNYFIRCWDGVSEFNTIQEAQVGTHNHAFSGSTGAGTPHSHTRGTMNITGTFSPYALRGWQLNVAVADYSGCFTYMRKGTAMQRSENAGSSVTTGVSMSADKSWTGATSVESSHTHTLSGMTSNNADEKENRVLNKMLVPMIKY